MLAAAVLLLLNLIQEDSSRGESFGFPFEMLFYMETNRLLELDVWTDIGSQWWIAYRYIAANSGLAITILLAIALVFEVLNRKLDAKIMKLRFQIHLSTAVVLMILAGVLIELNLEKWVIHQTVTVDRSILDLQRGWPFSYFYCAEFSDPDGKKYTVISPHRKKLMVANLLAGVLVLGTTASLVEWMIRRKDRRHEAKQEQL